MKEPKSSFKFDDEEEEEGDRRLFQLLDESYFIHSCPLEEEPIEAKG